MKIFNVCIFFLILLFEKSSGSSPPYEACISRRCEKGPSIRFPFYIDGLQESFCGFFKISCGSSGYPIYRLSENAYAIKQIFYESQFFSLYNVAIDNFAENCLSEIRNVTPRAPIVGVASESRLHLLSRCGQSLPEQIILKYGVNCGAKNGDGVKLAMLENDLELNSAIQQCETNVVAPVELYGTEGRNGMVDYEGLLRRGFSLSWKTRNCTICEESGGRCGINSITNGFRCFCPYGKEYASCQPTTRKNKSKIILATAAPAGGVVLLLILAFCLRRKLIIFCPCMESWKLATEDEDLEIFLKNYGSLTPKRYSYSEVKKMTNSFDTKLGEGGYGSVYKGKLQGGNLVAVKVLKESKGKGDEFINEVASISRTSHVNIVSLLGFCVQGLKKALIFEFMPNGSLEKFIYEKKSSMNHQLEWETLYNISVGIARGLEYLHGGCSTRILHFDIKPHNILLDESFCPKISDFGLAKLCTRKDSIISTMAARGTIGYIAPEIVCKNIGGVSHKSDVYSYGMMVLEMVGGRKNVVAGADHTSQIYFPHWIYTRLCQGEPLGLSVIKDDKENQQARKMLIVSLWCVQTNPSSRPTITQVLEMLEGPLEAIQMPPKPFLYDSPSRSASSEGFTK